MGLLASHSSHAWQSVRGNLAAGGEGRAGGRERERGEAGCGGVAGRRGGSETTARWARGEGRKGSEAGEWVGKRGCIGQWTVGSVSFVGVPRRELVVSVVLRAAPCPRTFRGEVFLLCVGRRRMHVLFVCSVLQCGGAQLVDHVNVLSRAWPK